MTLPATLYYFGCDRGPGHYLFGPHMARVRYDGFNCFDGSLAPKDDGQRQFVAQPWRLPEHGPAEWGGVSALAWWDRTEDRRPGSNSVLIAPGLTVTAVGIYELGLRLHPKVIARAMALTILGGWQTAKRGELR